MRTKAQWLQKSLEFFEHMKAEDKPYEIMVHGKPLVVLPNVFSPKYSEDSKVFSREVPKLVSGKSLLEIGTGTGIVALHASLRGAKKIVATDINREAVRNAKANFRKYGLKASIRHGSLFKPIKKGEKFDIIFWNHPFNRTSYKTKDILLRSGLDHNYADLKGYFMEAKKHLTTSGMVLLGTGSIARISEVRRIAKAAGYMPQLLHREPTSFEAGGRLHIDSLLFSFAPVRTQSFRRVKVCTFHSLWNTKVYEGYSISRATRHRQDYFISGLCQTD